jgi:hypothetical protein
METPAADFVAAMKPLITTQIGPRNASTNSEGLRHYDWQGRKLPSVTTIRRLAGLPFGLHQWTVGKVVERAIDGYLDLGKILNNGTPESITAAKSWLRAATTAERDVAAALGTRVHDAATSSKPLSKVGADVAPFLRQYLDWLAISGAEVIAFERQVWNLKIGYAGTFDLFIRFTRDWLDIENGNLIAAAGTTWVVDLKTGKSTYPEHALQGIAYAMADHIGEDGVIDVELSRLLHAANGVAILHLGREGWKWQEVMITPTLWKGFRGLLAFAQWAEANPKIDTLVQNVTAGKAVLLEA